MSSFVIKRRHSSLNLQLSPVTLFQVAILIFAARVRASSTHGSVMPYRRSAETSDLRAAGRVSGNPISGCAARAQSAIIVPIYVSAAVRCPCFLSFTIRGDKTASWDSFFVNAASFQEWRQQGYLGDPTYDSRYSTVGLVIPSGSSFTSPQINVWITGSYVLAFRATETSQVCFVSSKLVFESMLPACPVVVQPGAAQKIVGGSNVHDFIDPVYGFRWIAVIMWSGQYPICGGSHIAPGFILTAGHCKIQDDIGLYAVRLATPDASSGTLFKIRRVWVHPNFTEPSSGEVYNDIAILEITNRDTALDTHVVNWSTDSSAPGIGEFATTAGFGEISKNWGTNPEPNLIRRVDLPIWASASCKLIYRGLQPAQHICAGYPSGNCDSCQCVRHSHHNNAMDLVRNNI
jgi:hypothetical protein